MAVIIQADQNLLQWKTSIFFIFFTFFTNRETSVLVKNVHVIPSRLSFWEISFSILYSLNGKKRPAFFLHSQPPTMYAVDLRVTTKFSYQLCGNPMEVNCLAMLVLQNSCQLFHHWQLTIHRFSCYRPLITHEHRLNTNAINTVSNAKNEGLCRSCTDESKSHDSWNDS